MQLVFLGPPGAGKGTQAKLLAESKGLLHLSTGELLRDAKARGTPTGLEAKAYMDKGELVPDGVVDTLVAERLDGENRYILDGYPRKPSQAEALSRLLAGWGTALDLVLFLDVADEVLIARIDGRADRRADDAAEVVRNRLAVYRAETEPLVQHYEDAGLLRRIAGDRSIEEVAKGVAAAVEGIPA